MLVSLLVIGYQPLAAESQTARQAGADDYLLLKDVGQLVTRIQLILRRKSQTATRASSSFHGRHLSVVPSDFTATVDETRAILTRQEFRMLAYMVENRGRVITRGELLLNACSGKIPPDSRTVDVHIRRLRK